jgi:hypothetical protein
VKQIYSEDGGCLQADFLAHAWLFRRSVESRTLLTIDLNDYYRWDPNWTYATTAEPVLAAWNATGSGRVVTLNRDLEPIAPLTYFPNDWVWGKEVPGQTRKGRITVLGGLCANRPACSMAGSSPTPARASTRSAFGIGIS